MKRPNQIGSAPAVLRVIVGIMAAYLVLIYVQTIYNVSDRKTAKRPAKKPGRTIQPSSPSKPAPHPEVQAAEAAKQPPMVVNTPIPQDVQDELARLRSLEKSFRKAERERQDRSESLKQQIEDTAPAPFIPEMSLREINTPRTWTTSAGKVQGVIERYQPIGEKVRIAGSWYTVADLSPFDQSYFRAALAFCKAAEKSKKASFNQWLHGKRRAAGARAQQRIKNKKASYNRDQQIRRNVYVNGNPWDNR